MQRSSRRILVFGAGMMVEPLIDYFLLRQENEITLASNIFEVAKQICLKKDKLRCIPEEIDVVADKPKLKKLVEAHEIVVSYIPPSLHMHVAEVCLDVGRNLITSSYISPEMQKISDQVKNKGLIFMNEIGLDPGLDHIFAHKVINEAKRNNEKIISYESWCGALVAPEFANNPMMYKFSWSPRGVLTALRNNASFLLNGKVMSIPSTHLLFNPVNKAFSKTFNFEGYYNRDSLKYKELYGLFDAETLIRGTIRYKGYTFIFQCFKHLDLFNLDTNVSSSNITWRDFINSIIRTKEGLAKIETSRKKYFDGKPFEIRHRDGTLEKGEKEWYQDLICYCLSGFSDEYFKKSDIVENVNRFYAACEFLGFYCPKNNIKTNVSVLDSFAALLEHKLKMGEDERDLVFMQNEFIVERIDGRRVNKKYDLLVMGNHNNTGYSATALTVAYPTAITAQLILDGKVVERGVLMPTSDTVIDAVLKELERLKVIVQEEVVVKSRF